MARAAGRPRRALVLGLALVAAACTDADPGEGQGDAADPPADEPVEDEPDRDTAAPPDERLEEIRGAQNYHRFCPTPEVSETLLATNRTLDPDERAGLMNEAGAALAEDVPILPLYQLPEILVWDDSLAGLEVNTTQQGNLWNVTEWESDNDTVVWGYEQEGESMNLFLVDGNYRASSQVGVAQLIAPFVTTPDFEYVETPLLDSWELDEGPPFAVTLTLNADAIWSDGEPLTADDVLFMLETQVNEDWPITSRAGYDRVDFDETELLDDHTIRVVFTEPYAPWQSLFSIVNNGLPLPRHVVEGQDFESVWDDGFVDPDTGEPIASGPFMFESYDRGQQFVLQRNDAYAEWAGDNTAIDRIVFRFIPDIATQVQQLRGGEINLMDPQVQLDISGDLEGIDGITMDVDVGPSWEHLDFQHTRPPLDQAYVRQAIAMAIDRPLFVEQFVRPMYPEASPLNSMVYVSNQDEYEDHFGDVTPYDPDGAEALLGSNGCERDDDGVWTCEGERLEFEWTSTAGNERRELFFDVAQQSLAAVGIQINDGFGELATVFSPDVIEAGNWELFNFGWSGSPDPVDNVELYGCFERENGTPVAGAAPDG